MPKIKPIVPAALVLPLFCSPVYAQTDTAADAGAGAAGKAVQLQEVTVGGRRAKPAAVEEIDRSQIDTQMIRDTHDLVRYSPDVGLSDSGRHQKGFAMRGVEGNRVGISIDGVNLPDSEENTLYARYGNFNPSRQSIDPELVRGISLAKGAGSFESGSGALGGRVAYRTLDAGDIITDGKHWGALLRSGYGSKNREWTHTLGSAYQGESLEAVLLYSRRSGHETKSAGGGDITRGDASQHPDPAKHTQHSYLGKLAWQINPGHRAGVSLSGQNGSNYTDERSYILLHYDWREADDRHKRLNTNLFYEYTPDSDWLSLLRADYDYQRTQLSAVNYKGSYPYDWAAGRYSDEKELSEIFDRRMNTRFHRISLRADTQPFQAAGEHRISLRAHLAQRDFHNINYDRGGIGSSYEYLNVYTIQHPMRTVQAGISLQDHIRWNGRFSGRIGLRYDREKVTPQNLNAKCSSACTAEGRPGGKTFHIWSGFAGLDMQLNPVWKTGYQISTGYRIPTASEMYFSFKNPYGTWKSNPGLKPERSVSHTLSLQGRGVAGSLNLAAYHTRYRDFLSEQTTLIEETGYGRTWQTPVNQTVNLDYARISGLEFQGSLNLDSILPVSAGWKLSGSLGYSKGRLSEKYSLLSIQPLKAVIGLDYEQPEGRWGIFGRLSYLGSKKAADAQVENVKSRCVKYEYHAWFGHDICTKTELYKESEDAKYLNRRAYVFDVSGYWRPVKNLTLRAGVYNLFNRKYHTWDALRGINTYGTTHTVDKEGKGLERLYAPGRNFAASVEYRF